VRREIEVAFAELPDVDAASGRRDRRRVAHAVRRAKSVHSIACARRTVRRPEDSRCCRPRGLFGAGMTFRRCVSGGSAVQSQLERPPPTWSMPTDCWRRWAKRGFRKDRSIRTEAKRSLGASLGISFSIGSTALRIWILLLTARSVVALILTLRVGELHRQLNMVAPAESGAAASDRPRRSSS